MEIENFTVAQLREYAKTKNLPIKGISVLKKADLLQAIQDALAGRKPTAKPDYTHQKKYSTTHYEQAEISRLRTRVQEGQTPRKSTLDKYNITIDQVNLWRAEKNLEPIAMPTPLLSIPRAKAIKAIENQNRAEMQVANQLAESAKTMFEAKETAVAAAKKINNEKLETIVNLKFGKLSLDDIANFFRLKTTYNPEGRSINTVDSYVGRMRFLFEKVLGCSNNVLECLNKKDIVDKIIKKYPNPNTRHSYIKVLSILFREFPGIQQHINKEVVDAVQAEFSSSKNKAEARNVSKVNNEVEPFPVIKEKILAAFPKNSKEHLLAELYDQFNARDDFGNVILIEDASQVKRKKQNYMIYKNPVVLILQVYKTAHRYGKVVLPATNSKIYDILKAQGKKTGDLLIGMDKTGEMYNDKGALSSIVSRMLTTAGVKRFGDRQAINLLRAAKKTELLNQPNLTPEDYELIANNAMHSPLMQLKYMRKIRKELMTDPAPDDDAQESPYVEDPIEVKEPKRVSKKKLADQEEFDPTPKSSKKSSKKPAVAAKKPETPPLREEPKQTRYNLRGKKQDSKKELGGGYISSDEEVAGILNLRPPHGSGDPVLLTTNDRVNNMLHSKPEVDIGSLTFKPGDSSILKPGTTLVRQVNGIIQDTAFKPQKIGTLQRGHILSKTVSKLKDKPPIKPQ